jgi:uncharacterized membrane protein YfcA
MRKKKSPAPASFIKSAVFGVAGGFSTMIGNAAGPVMSVYLLSMKLPKVSFIGTAAWFFMIINYLKLPLQILVWHNISSAGLRFGITMIPAILLGAAVGVLIIKKVPERNYRILVYAMTLISTVLLFVSSR